MVAQSAGSSGPTASKIVGIIYPPPDIRNIIDKTAQYVAKNGADFLNRIQANEASNPKFSFLKDGDPYNAYFQMRVNEGPQPDGAERPAAVPAAAPVPIKAAEPDKTVEPPPEFEFSLTVPSISAQNIDIVKLTAQFVARNGKQFLTSLMQKEYRNHHFDFLKPDHSLFNYFTKLVEHYTKILIPPMGVKDDLKKASTDKFSIYDRIQKRVEWEEVERERKQRDEDLIAKEKLAFLQIDWHDFTVVETIPFAENDASELPPPVNIKTLLARVLEQERLEALKGGAARASAMDTEEQEMIAEAEEARRRDEHGDDDDMDMEMDMGSPEPEPEPEPVAAPAPIIPDKVVIRKDYNPKERKKQDGGVLYQTCPNCGLSIPANELAEHIRIELLDPQWREQKLRLERERAAGQEVYASAQAMEHTLKHIAEFRTDIFGSDEKEFDQKVLEEKKRNEAKVTWDGHTSSMAATAKKAQDMITPEDLKPAPAPEPIGPMVTSATHINPSPAVPGQPRPPAAQQQFMGARPPLMGNAPGFAPMGGFVQPGMMGMAPGMMTQGMQGQSQFMSMPPGPPGVAPGGAPPGTGGMAPPSMGPPGMAPPRPPAMGPPGMAPPGMGPPGMAPPGLVPPGMAPPGLAPPGMGPPGMAPPGMGPPGVPPPAPAGMPMSVTADDIDEGGASKRIKLDSAPLMPEDQWAATHPVPVTVSIAVPMSSEYAQWNFNGQVLSFTGDVRTPISRIKDFIQESLGMPQGKQKLQLNGAFAKDNDTLAFYNAGNDSVIQLSVKERGGRKK